MIARIAANILNFRKGWKTKRKLVVFESDDWGAIRTSSRDAYRKLENLGYNMSTSCYNLDSLESNNDLEMLYEHLSHIEDKNGSHPVFTANMVMANPDFYKIKNSSYSEYFYEDVRKTLSNIPESKDVELLWKEGNAMGVFYPQFHCREHVRFWEWMKDLHSKKYEAQICFDLKMCGVPRATSKDGTSYFRTPYIDKESLSRNNVEIELLVKGGLHMFRRIFGYNSESTVAPNVGWTDSTEHIWEDSGVKYIQGGVFQRESSASGENLIPHYLGEHKRQLTYLVRNCNFEPAKKEAKYCAPRTLNQISRAFSLGMPAIICTHRVNYIGTISEENRENSLLQLKYLLSSIARRWPDVEFVTSVQLGEIINNEYVDCSHE